MSQNKTLSNDRAPHRLAQTPFLKARVARLETLRDDIRRLIITPEAPYFFKAGQYCHLAFADLDARPYSIACGNHEHDGQIEIHVKRGRGAASQYVMDSLKEGDGVKLYPAQGDMIYDHAARFPVLMIAGGLGIAPLKAITEQALYENHAHKMHLLWSAQDESHLYLRSYFDDLAAKNPLFDARFETGSHILSALNSLNPDFYKECYVFLSGPPLMINASVPFLLDKGAQSTRISYDPHPEAVKLSSL